MEEDQVAEPVAEPKKTAVKPKVTVIVAQPKVQKVAVEKKPLTDKQKATLQRMNEARKAKQTERKDEQKRLEAEERKEREDAVRKAEEEAKAVADEVVVQKIRGRKAGVPNKPKVERVRHEAVSKAQPAPRELSHREYTILALRQRGIQVADDATPYALKLITARMR